MNKILTRGTITVNMATVVIYDSNQFTDYDDFEKNVDA